MSERLEYDDSQLAVVEADASSRLVVTAAAGQGKTEVVVGRLEDLQDQGIDLTDGVLVLSFSRAAVNAVRKRARQSGLNALEIRTFDSFAGKVVSEAGGLDQFQGGFDAKIRQATELMKSDDQFRFEYDHVIIDESQDLVGDRAEMVLVLVSCLEATAGFTVLGDPLQGIYDFQLEGTASASNRTSFDLHSTLLNDYDGEQCELTRHYRATSERTAGIIPIAARLRAMLESGVDAKDAHSELDHYRVNGGPEAPYKFRSLESLTGYLEDLDEGESTAILTTTNYEALRVSEILDSLNILHVVRRRAQDAGIARWVGAVLGALELRKYSRQEFDEIIQPWGDSLPFDAWHLLKEVENDTLDHKFLNIQVLNRRMRNVALPVEMTSDDERSVEVSTVHRAKGLEFDYVIDVEPEPGSPGAELNLANLRRRYVASSRPRQELFVLQRDRESGSFAKKVGERWVEYRFGAGGRRYPARMEFINDDIETSVPCTPQDADPLSSQQILSGRDLWGEKVNLVLDRSPALGNVAFYWVQMENKEILGRTNSKFGSDVARIMQRKQLDDPKLSWPKRLEGARIVSVETVAGDPEVSSAAGLGPSGFWQVVRLSGLINVARKKEGARSHD